MTNRPKYAHLLEDADFKRWHNGIRNKATRGNYLRMAGLFFERTDTTPVGLVKMPSKARWDLIEDYLNAHPNAAEGTRKALNSWFERSEIQIPKYVKNPEQEHPRIDAAHVPSPEELKRVLIAADAPFESES